MHTPDVRPSTLPMALRNLYFQWRELQIDGRSPRMTELQVHHLVGSEHSTILTEAIFDADGAISDFIFLFLDTHLRNGRTQQIPGKGLAQLPGKGPGSRIWGALAACITDGVPLRASFPYVGPDPAYDKTCDVLLPVADDTGRHRYVLTGVIFLPSSAPSII
ncbi:hypothetical protein GGQ68_000226 [Sagittula marina]|uniref:PAS domain-containing protein n=1 Tax=Sagittula marina TaxID=943940 RepID=A0A7W6GQI3_9RHOB|nr:hypothetical protein [Sagittula marina]MBB3983915.1 hypothetical protein [Sagittula marina]